MNREIKFRGKRVDNGEWVYGMLDCIYKEDGFTTISYVDNEGFYCEDKVDYETVGQFTGIVIDNQEIYEGDILTDEFEMDLYVIVFEEGSFRAYCKERNYLRDLYMDIEDVHLYLHKIGNIHDNTDLLK